MIDPELASERARARRRAGRKIIMGGVFGLAVLAGAGLFVMSQNSTPVEVASQELVLPSAPQPLISPPDEPIPSPTLPPVPLPDAQRVSPASEPAPAPVPEIAPTPLAPIEPAPLP